MWPSFRGCVHSKLSWENKTLLYKWIFIWLSTIANSISSSHNPELHKVLICNSHCMYKCLDVYVCMSDRTGLVSDCFSQFTYFVVWIKHIILYSILLFLICEWIIERYPQKNILFTNNLFQNCRNILETNYTELNITKI